MPRLLTQGNLSAGNWPVIDRNSGRLQSGIRKTPLTLYQFVTTANPSASAKQIKRASLIAMADLDLPDKSAMEVIYSIAFDRGLRLTV